MAKPKPIRNTFFNSGKLVVGSGLGANQLVVFVNAMNEMGKIFESPVKLEKKVYKFEPMALAA
jgi:hypothetical protein